ncbi:MAG: type VI secretion system VgrG family protein [Neolewinella sp.]|jgi:type VI secretion system VgrG family protein
MSYFADLDSKRFSFVSNAMGMNEQTFAVINFKGYESISKPYEFDILLVSNEMELDLGDVLNSSAQFLIHRGGDAGKDDVLFNGVLASFEQLQEFNGNVIYRAKLVPKLWWLSLTKHNQVFLDDNVPELVRLCLEDADLLPSDFDFSGITGDYQPHEYVCQYGETHFTFVSRWLEREGIYYYFSQEDDGEIIQFSDANTTAETLDDADLFYSPESGLESTHLSEVIRALTCRQKQLPKEVILKDYNYEKPSLDVTGRAAVDPEKGRGNHYVYGEHFPTPEEGDRLALIRAEELLCQQKEFYGESTVPFMNPGYTFNLLNHYRGDYNQEYLVLEVTHEGSQTACLTPEIVGGLDKPDEKVAYTNSFKAIPSITQFRPERTTERPRISGTLNAKIDSEGDGEYAELDGQGRYKVKLPFDVNDQVMNGKASARVRMMQPYAGKNKGMQFPLNKGTEVLLSFIDGHPDRPIIAGAVNNPNTPPVVTATNQTRSKVSMGGSGYTIESKIGKEFLHLHSKASNTVIGLGMSDRSLAQGLTLRTEKSYLLAITGDQFFKTEIFSNGKDLIPTLKCFDEEISNRPDTQAIETDHDITEKQRQIMFQKFGNPEEYNPSGMLTFGDGKGNGLYPDTMRNRLKGAHIVASSYDTITTQSGNIYDFGGYWNYNLGNSYSESFLAQRYDDEKKLHVSDALLNAVHQHDLLNKAGPHWNKIKWPCSEPLPAEDRKSIKFEKLDFADPHTVSKVNFGEGLKPNVAAMSPEEFVKALGYGAQLGTEAATDWLHQAGQDALDWGEKASEDAGNWFQDQAAVIANFGKNVANDFNDLLKGNNVLSKEDCELEGDYSAMWVDKKFGHSYDYLEGDSISVTEGSSLNVQYGGRHIDIGYRGKSANFSLASWSHSENGENKEKKWNKAGLLTLDSWSKPGESDEKKYDRNTGALFSHEISTSTGMSTASFSFNFGNKASCDINTGTSIELNVEAAVKLNVGVYASAVMDISGGVGLKAEVKTFAGGTLEADWGYLDYKIVGFNAKKKAEAAAEVAALELKTMVSNIQNINLSLKAGGITLKQMMGPNIETSPLSVKL